MKRSIILLLAVFLLAGCASREPSLGELTDSHESYPYHPSVQTNQGYLETEFATYLVRPDVGLKEIGELLCVCPKGSDTFVPLCGRPNCAHNDPNCNAAVGMPLGFYKNRLYSTEIFIRNSMDYADDVISILPDGSDRQLEMSVPWIMNGDGTYHSPDNQLFHNGKLIRIYRPEYGAPYEEQISHIQIVDLETKKVTEPFAEQLTVGVNVSFVLRPVGQYIYATIEYRQPDGSLDYWRVQMDMQTGAIQKLFQIENDGAFYDESYTDENAIYWFVPDEGFYEYDLTTGETASKGMPVPEIDYVVRDGDYIYGFPAITKEPGKRAMYVLDWNYSLVDTLPLPDYMVLRFLNSEYLFFGIWQQSGENAITATVDRSTIGTGKLALNIQKEVSFEGSFAGGDTEPEETQPAAMSFYEESYEAADPAAGLKDLGTFFSIRFEDEMGYYGILYIVPKGEMTPVPMCKKQGCDHTGEDCNAFFRTAIRSSEEEHGVGAGGFGIYQDRLYIFGVQPDYTIDLYSVDPVTWERRLEKNYPIPEADFAWKSHSLTATFLGDTILLHHGLTKQDDSIETSYVAVDLATLEEKPDFAAEVAPAVFGCDGDLAHTPEAWIGNVAVMDGFQSAIINGREELIHKLLEMRLDTGECRWLMQTQRQKGEYYADLGGYTATRDTLYYFLETGDFHEYDRKTGQDTVYPCPREDTITAYYLNDLILVLCDPTILNYIYPDSDEPYMFDPEEFASRKYEMMFFTRDYQLLCTIGGLDGGDTRPIAESDEYCWFFDASNGAIRALSKAQIAQGCPEFIRVN